MIAISGPKVSVLMSCYNASPWLRYSVGSVLNQTYRNFEFIVVDDGSDDDTLAILQHYAARDRRIVVISKENTGLADSLNYGMAKATGEWIARQDADDISEPTRLEKQVQYVKVNSDIVFVGTGLYEIDKCGHKLSTHRYPLIHKVLVMHLYSAQKFPPHSSAFYRTEVARSIGGYRARIRRAEDMDLWLRLSEVGELACLDEPLVQIRKHAGQISNDESGRRQLVDSRVAMICYWLRKKVGSDLIDAEEATFNVFYAWLERELMDDGFFEFQDFKRHLKVVLSNNVSCAYGWPNCGLYIMEHPLLFFRLLRECLWGDLIAFRLAKRWIEVQKTCI